MKQIFNLSFLLVFGFIVGLSQIPNTQIFEPIIIDDSITVISLKDYFPTIKETAYRLKHVPEGVDIQENDYKFTLHGKQNQVIDCIAISISFIEYAIPIVKHSPNNGLGAKNKIKQGKYDSELMSLDILNVTGSTEHLVLLDNQRLPFENIEVKTDRIKLKIPNHLKIKNKSLLRIFYSDSDKGYNVLDIPLAYGMPING